MLLQDCAKADMQTASAVTVKQPEMSGKLFVLAGSDLFSYQGLHPGSSEIIRGPPPDWPGSSQILPSILLATMRFRQ